MAPITETFQAHLEASAPTWAPEGAARVVSNASGTFYAPTRDAVVAGLARQVAGAVRWVDNMRALADGAGPIYEIGPKRPLRGFFRALGIEVVAITNRTTARRALGS